MLLRVVPTYLLFGLGCVYPTPITLLGENYIDGIRVMECSIELLLVILIYGILIDYEESICFTNFIVFSLI